MTITEIIEREVATHVTTQWPMLREEARAACLAVAKAVVEEPRRLALEITDVVGEERARWTINDYHQALMRIDEKARAIRILAAQGPGGGKYD